MTFYLIIAGVLWIGYLYYKIDEYIGVVHWRIGLLEEKLGECERKLKKLEEEKDK